MITKIIIFLWAIFAVLITESCTETIDEIIRQVTTETGKKKFLQHCYEFSVMNKMRNCTSL